MFVAQQGVHFYQKKLSKHINAFLLTNRKQKNIDSYMSFMDNNNTTDQYIDFVENKINNCK